MNKQGKEIPISKIGRELYNKKTKLTYKTFVKLTFIIWTILLVLCPTIPLIYILNNLQSPIIYKLLTTLPLLIGIEFIAGPTLAFTINALLISTRKVLFKEHKELYKIERKIANLKFINEKGKTTLTKDQINNLGTFSTITKTPIQPRKPLVASTSPEFSGVGAKVRK